MIVKGLNISPKKLYTSFPNTLATSCILQVDFESSSTHDGLISFAFSSVSQSLYDCMGID